MKSGCDCWALKIEVAETYEAMSRRAEQLIVTELRRKPALILCASAGGTPTRLYGLLAVRFRREPNLFKKMRVLQIDEWGGLAKGHPASCETDLRIKLLEPLAIRKERQIGFRTEAQDREAECARIKQWLGSNGPIDICILGLGRNGHVAMNEPAEALVPHAHIARLSRSSLNHPMLKNLQQKPGYGLTVGIADILSSRMVLMLVNGQHKRAPMKRLLRPAVTTRFPASFLWLHPRAVVLCDREAAVASQKRNSKL
jgi:galactosamine-6-phosphate isomerase